MSLIITGGCGFIGINFIKKFLNLPTDEDIINIDNLTYSANLVASEELKKNKRYVFMKGDINDQDLISNCLNKYKPRAIINFAAETHVDRSIDNPHIFIKSNILGTYNLLECSRRYLNGKSKDFRFIHVSTDEVFGSLELNDKPFHEKSNYDPSSPYSSSKAASDHLARSWGRTYNLPVIVTNCSNNYGPYQHVEKLIPHMIFKAMKNLTLPVYGAGQNIRDWLFVEDHCEAIYEILNNGKIHSNYCIGGNSEVKNIDLVEMICDILDEIRPKKESSYKDLIQFVDDRPGHDLRYAINASKIRNELKWKPKENLATGLKKTINWYLKNNYKN